LVEFDDGRSYEMGTKKMYISGFKPAIGVFLVFGKVFEMADIGKVSTRVMRGLLLLAMQANEYTRFRDESPWESRVVSALLMHVQRCHMGLPLG
jgi:hypothetical protein